MLVNIFLSEWKACNELAAESCSDMASLDLHEKANFTRLSRLLVDKGTEALRNTFDAIHFPASLSAVLSANKTSLLKLKPRVINDSQWDLLYPPSGDPADSKTFDVTLLTVLFRNICGLPKPGWGVMPADSNRSMLANVVRLRLFRNEIYAHVTSTQLDNATFECLWKRVSQTLVDLNISQKDIDELKTCPLGPGEEEYVRILQDWKLHEEESLIMLEGINNDVKSMKSSINRLTEISQEKRDVEVNRSLEKDEDLLRKLAKHNFKSKIKRKVELFKPGSREWLLKEVGEWFFGNENKSRILLLTAGPGFGKSVFSAKICENFKEKGMFAGCHFCDFNDSNLRDPMMMLQSLASQMCENVVGFKEKLLDHLKRPHKLRSLRDGFRIYLQNPLDELELAEPVLIVIDGLDESAADDKSDIVNLIADYFPDLPAFMKVLVTSRPDISVTKIGASPRIDIDYSNADNNSDLKAYLQSCLPSLLQRKKRRLGKEYSGVFEKLVEMCEGSFLYAFFVQCELQKCSDLDHLMLDEIAEFLPKGLHSVYHAYFRRLEDELKSIIPGNFDVLKILEMLVASKGPLPLTFVTTVLGLSSDCRETKNIINKVNVAMSCLLYVSDDQVTVFHKSVVDWLLAKGYDDHEYTVQLINGEKSLWIMCEQVFEEIKKIVCSGDDLNLTNNSYYALAHGLRHLALCRMTESYAWLVDVVVVHFILFLYEGDIDRLLKYWNDFLRDKGCIIDDKLRGRISWHIIEIEISYWRDNEEHCRWYLTSVVTHARRIYFSEEDWDIAKKLLSKYSSLVDINCKHKVEIIPHAVRHLSSNYIGIAVAGLSNDHSMVAFATVFNGTVTLLDLPHLDERWQYATQCERISCFTFFPDDSRILFGKLKTALRVADGKEVPFFHNNKETFVSCGFSPNGKRLVTSNGSSTFKLWDITKQSQLSLFCTESPVESCSFNSTGLFIITNCKSNKSGSFEKTDVEDSFCVWNAVTWQRCDERNKKEKTDEGDLCKRCFPATFELPAFKRLNIKPRQPLQSWSRESFSTGIFKGEEYHFAWNMDSFCVVENTHFTTLGCWTIALTNPYVWNRDRCDMMMIDHDLWLCICATKLIVFETVSTPKHSSCLHSPAQVYSSSFSSDSSRFATCTSDGCVNIWNVDGNQIDQRFKCNQEELPFACWWSQKFLFVFHVSHETPTLSKYPMDATLKILLSQRETCHFPTSFAHFSTVLDFSEGFLIFEGKNANPSLVVDVTGSNGLRIVNLPQIQPKMSITVSPRCSFVCGAGLDMFYIWKRNSVEASDYEVFFNESLTENRVLNDAVPYCSFSCDSNIAVVASLKQLTIFGQSFQIIDLDTGNYKTLNVQCMAVLPRRLFCFNGVVIYAIKNEIIILDLETGMTLDRSFQRYLTAKFVMQMKISPNKSTLAVPMVNGDMEFIRLRIAQNPSLPNLKAKRALDCANSSELPFMNFMKV